MACTAPDGHDGVVAIGGGAALDTGKTIAFMSGQTLPLWDFEDIGDYWTPGQSGRHCTGRRGSDDRGHGLEVEREASYWNEQTHQKKIIFHPLMMPRIVILDAELTVGLPRAVTAATGMDAFVHCFEAFCAPGFHPLADGVALEGLRIIATHLPRACANGGDIEARAYMLAAAAMGATAFQKGLGAVHGIAHPVGSFYATHHGLTNAVILPYVMVFNRAAIEAKCGIIARNLALPQPGFDGLLSWVVGLRHELGIPHTLAEIGVTADQAALIGREAAIDPWPAEPGPGGRGCARGNLPGGGHGPAREPSMPGRAARILVIDGNLAAVRARLRAALGYDTGEGYVRVLGRLDPGMAADIVCPADTDIELPAGVALGDYDGVTMTGYALNIYHGGDPVERQIALVQAVFSAGVPFFGSCWGLQVAVTAAGGSVHRNRGGANSASHGASSSPRAAVGTPCTKASPRYSKRPRSTWMR